MKFLLLLLAFALISCSADRHAGGSSEHENVLQAVILDTAAQPLAGARVWLRPADYHSNSSTTGVVETTSDSEGKVRAILPSSGSYWMEVRKDGFGRLLQVSTDSFDLVVARVAPLGVLQKCFGVESKGKTMHVMGMNTSMTISDNGCVILDSMPEGDYELNIFEESVEAQLSHGLRILIPGRTPVAAPVWIPIQIAATDLDFLMVSERSGLQATDANGVVLGVDFEDWESTSGSAVAWVRLDSLPTTGATVFLVQEPFTVKSPNAFALAQDGWFHVWHFTQKDASSIENEEDAESAGIVAMNYKFEANSQLLKMDADASLSEQGYLSFWIRMEGSINEESTMIVNAGGLQLLVLPVGSSTRLDVKLAVGPETTIRLESKITVGDENWHLISLKYRVNEKAILEMDGVLQDSENLPSSIIGITDSIGFGGFEGALDEIRLGSGATYNSNSQLFDYSLQSQGSSILKISRF